jgi:hypothetical protein
MTEHTNHSSDSAPTNGVGHDEPVRPARRYRGRGPAVRGRRLTPRFSDAELADVQAAAAAARMTVTGFCARAALAMASRAQARPSDPSGGAPPEVLAELQRELFAARTAVNRTGVNLNQAMTVLNSTGEVPVWLAHAVERVARSVAGVDAVVAMIHHRLGGAGRR